MRRVVRSVRLMVSASVALLVLTGCLGDPPPDPETAPLEVVLDECVLNRSEVTNGEHQVTAIGSGERRVRNASGEEVLSLRGGGGGRLTTTSQTYTFTCTFEGNEEFVDLTSAAERE